MRGSPPVPITQDFTADELTALVAAGEVVLTHRFLLRLTVPIGEALLRSGVAKMERILADADIEAATVARRRANSG